MTANYDLLRVAVTKKLPVKCLFQGFMRELCPHVLGLGKSGEEKVLSFQFAGGSSRGLPPGGEWRCMAVSEMSGIQIVEGTWHTRASHSRPQTCVKIIDVEIDDED